VDGSVNFLPTCFFELTNAFESSDAIKLEDLTSPFFAFDHWEVRGDQVLSMLKLWWVDLVGGIFHAIEG
jgi:hypothetical protein